MNDYTLIHFGRIVLLIGTIVMIVQARRMFNGMARGLILLACLLVMRSLDDLFGFLDPFQLTVLSLSVVGVFAFDVWRIWRDRKEHADWLIWREECAEELRLAREWQKRTTKWKATEIDLERMRIREGW
jgi:uncharacterized membrane protein YccC